MATCQNQNESINYYCGESWANFWDPYYNVHAHLVLTVGVIGVITNILNVVIYTRSYMRNPTNTLLTALSLFDLLFVLSEVITRSISFYRFQHGDNRSSYQQNVEQIINYTRFRLFHTMSIYLTLIIGLWRICGLFYPVKSRIWWTTRNALWAILASGVISIVLVGLLSVGDEIIRVRENVYKIYHSKKGALLNKLINGIFIKIIPSVLLTCITLGLIQLLIKRQKNRQNLSQNGKTKNRKDRTTRMLVGILVIFLVAELPPGILQFVYLFATRGNNGNAFHCECIWPIVGIFTLNEILSSSTNFFVYLAMSSQFRFTLINFFKPFDVRGKSVITNSTSIS